MASPHKDLFLAARSFLLSHGGIIETRKDRITTYSDANGGICHMRTMPHGIDIGFLKGAKMDDPQSKLTGKGKVMRVLPLATMDQDIVRGFLAQAVAINAAKV